MDSSLAWESGIAGRENLYEPEAESRSWAGERTPVESAEITRIGVVSISFCLYKGGRIMRTIEIEKEPLLFLSEYTKELGGDLRGNGCYVVGYYPPRHCNTFFGKRMWEWRCAP